MENNCQIKNIVELGYSQGKISDQEYQHLLSIFDSKAYQSLAKEVREILEDKLISSVITIKEFYRRLQIILQSTQQNLSCSKENSEQEEDLQQPQIESAKNSNEQQQIERWKDQAQGGMELLGGIVAIALAIYIFKQEKISGIFVLLFVISIFAIILGPIFTISGIAKILFPKNIRDILWGLLICLFLLVAFSLGAIAGWFMGGSILTKILFALVGGLVIFGVALSKMDGG